MKMKMTCRTNSTGKVTLAYATVDGRVERSFFTPRNGGYIWEEFLGRPGTLGQQVGPRLGHSGNMLSCSRIENLAVVIRREYRALRRGK